jgi:hypothetical protein
MASTTPLNAAARALHQLKAGHLTCVDCRFFNRSDLWGCQK